jgi:hypothetical protein
MNTQDIMRRLFVPKNPIVIGVISCDHRIVKFWGGESGTIYVVVVPTNAFTRAMAKEGINRTQLQLPSQLAFGRFFD